MCRPTPLQGRNVRCGWKKETMFIVGKLGLPVAGTVGNVS